MATTLGDLVSTTGVYRHTENGTWIEFGNQWWIIAGPLYDLYFTAWTVEGKTRMFDYKFGDPPTDGAIRVQAGRFKPHEKAPWVVGFYDGMEPA